MDRTNWISLLKHIGLLSLLLASALIVLSAIERKEGNLVQEVKVNIEPLAEGELLVNEKDVLLIIERTFGHQITGLPLGAVPVDRLEEALEEDPFVRNADVFVDARDRVHVRVEQREPVLRIMDNNGLNYYLDEHGYRMPLSKHFTARVLVVNGNLPPYRTDFLERERYLLRSVFQLAEMIREDPFLKTMIEQIYADSQGELTLVPKIGDQKIRFGQPSGLADKLDRLRIFYREVVPQEGWQKYKTVSLEFAGQLVCKK